MKKLVSTILKTVIFFLGWVIFISFTPDILTNNQAYMRLWWEFAPFAILILFSVIFISLIEKGKIKIPVAYSLKIL